MAKFTLDQAIEIRRRYVEDQLSSHDLSRAYDVSVPTITKVLRGEGIAAGLPNVIRVKAHQLLIANRKHRWMKLDEERR